MNSAFIDPDEYRSIVLTLPVACVDLIIKAPDGRYLLVERRNEPLRGEWYLVGGRILHGEALRDATVRKLAEEVGIKADADDFRFVGYTEDVYDVNPFQDAHPYHTVTFVFAIDLLQEPNPTLDAQSSGWRLSDGLPERFVVIPSEPVARERA